MKNSKKLQSKPSLKEALQEFRFGYFTDAILAILYLPLLAYALWKPTELKQQCHHLSADQLVAIVTANIAPGVYFYCHCGHSLPCLHLYTAHDA